jgi:hypothetical protein
LEIKPQITQRGWHPQPIIAAGIRKCRRKNLGMKTRFGNIVIQRGWHPLFVKKI